MKLIDKDAIVAEIEKRKAQWSGMYSDYYNGQIKAYSSILSFLDTLEVKEVESFTDAFIEKACEFVRERLIFDDDAWYTDGDVTLKDKVIKEFKSI